MSNVPDKPDQATLERHISNDIQERSKPWHLPKFHLPKFSSKKTSERSPSRGHSPSGGHSPARAPRPKGPLDFTKDVPTNIPYPPFVHVEGVPNFRDMGGYACAAPPNAPTNSDMQYSVRRGYAFRCSELSQISPVGTVHMVHELNVKLLYDLRSAREAADLRGQPQGVVCISTPVFRREDMNPGMPVQQLYWSTMPDSPPNAGFSQGYVNWYRQILEFGAKYAYRVVFEHIRDQPDDPFVYHCTAGKDRTGVLSAVILKLCGVDDQTIAWEYSLTVHGMGVWEEAVESEMVGDSMMLIRSHGGMTKAEARRVCGSRAGNMREFLKQVLDGEMGGAAKYLMDYCHFSQAEVDTIRSHLVVPGEATVKAVSFPGYDEHLQT